jgi:uncharacterized protein (TIGR02147 family)
MIWEFTSYQTYLRATFVSKQRTNERYSLRRFASQIGLQPSLLSEIFNGKRRLSETAAAEVAQRLKLTSQERDYFFLLVRLEKTKSPALRSLIADQLRGFSRSKDKIQDLSADAFLAISDWYHFALLHLIDIKDFEWTTKKVATMLGLKEVQVIAGLERLERLDLIESPGEGRPKKIASDINVSSPKQMNEALRKYHTQMLEKTISSLTAFDPTQRFPGTETIKLNSEQFAEVSKTLEECFQRVLNLTDEVKPGAEVYHMGINLFPLSQRNILKEKDKETSK